MRNVPQRAVAALLALVVPLAHAQVRSSTNYSIVVDQINSGGGAASSASFQLRGSLGQPFDTRPMSSANFASTPGFQSVSPAPYLSISQTALGFGNQIVATSSQPLGVTLSNAGNVAISLSSIALGGTHPGDFGQVNPCGSSIAVGTNCAVSIMFTPQALGARSALLSINSSAPQSTPSVSLSGTGVAPDIDLSANAIAFGSRRVGLASTPQAVTVSNLGNAALTIGSLTITGAAASDFVLQAGSCAAPGEVAIAANCPLSVVFTPSAPGTRAATLTVGSNDPDESAVQVALSGTGLARARFDFNGDGRSDIVWRNGASGENYLFTMNATAIGADEGYLRTVADPSWIMAGIGDFDGDGKADILWRNTATGMNYVFLMNGAAIAGEDYLRQVADQNWVVAGVGDFNGDGRDDILWRNVSSGENYVFLMNGIAIAGEGYLRQVADHRWQVAGVGDLDGDGRSDLVWRNTSTGENYVHLLDGLTIKAEGYIRSVFDQNWQIAGVGDLDGDGKDDLFWRNRASGETYVFPMDGAAMKPTEGYVRTVADLNWQVVALGDYDGDGKIDVFWRNAATGDGYVYLMDGLAIKPAEGYTRNVADQNWQPQRTSAFAVRRGAVDGAQVPTASGATGTALVRMDLWTRRMVGRIEHSATATNAFIAHIHPGARGVDGGPIVFFQAAGAGAWLVMPNGVMPPENYLQFLSGATYVNVHTDAFPAGEIRGQLE